ncbi:hypothetical protein KAH81_05810 [bacterium]|nr:hypothetical protein [bacterium]
MKNTITPILLVLAIAAGSCMADWLISDTPTTKALNSVECIGYGYAYVVGDDRTLLYTSDYGATWDTVSAPVVASGLDFNDLFFWDDTTGLIVCDSGKIFFTSDGGSSWIENTTPVSNKHFYAVDFSPSGAGLAAGTSGWIVQGPDSLWNWEDWRLPTYTSRNFYSVCHPTDSLAYILAHKDILRLTAVGDTFNYIMGVDFSTIDMNGMCTLSGLPGWVYIVGDSGYVVFSSDSMSTCDVLAIYGNCDFNDIEFNYFDYGVICGDDGVIFESSDYGLDWDSVASGATRNLNDVDFWWDGYGLIVGRYGTILRSEDPVGIKENSENRPQSFALSAYPNPFNSAVTISVDCHSRENGNPEIEIFDIAGRRVDVIARRATPDAAISPFTEGDYHAFQARNDGISEFVWMPDETAGSGVYLVRANMGGCYATQKIIYLK